MDELEFNKQVFVGKIKTTGLYRLVPIPKGIDLKEGEDVVVISRAYFNKIGLTSGLVLEKEAFEAMKAMFAGTKTQPPAKPSDIPAL